MQDPKGRRRWGRRVNMCGTEGAERGKTDATATMATAAGRQIQTDDLPVCRTYDGAGGKYRMGGSRMGESADESSKWSGVEKTQRSPRRRRRLQLKG